jgi:hypothetical protein
VINCLDSPLVVRVFFTFVVPLSRVPRCLIQQKALGVAFSFSYEGWQRRDNHCFIPTEFVQPLPCDLEVELFAEVPETGAENKGLREVGL